MTIKQGIFTSEFLEKFGELTVKEFAEKYVSTMSIEESQQTIATNEVIIEPTSTEEPAANSEFKELTDNVAELISLIKISNHKDEVIDNLHKELMQYKQGLQEAIIAPLLKTIVREYGWISKQYRFYLEKSQEEPQSELFVKLLSEYKVLLSSFTRLLSDYDIEPFSFKEGDETDYGMQNIVEIVVTEIPEQDSTVAECITCGFRNLKNNRLFCQAEVKIYKLKNK